MSLQGSEKSWTSKYPDEMKEIKRYTLCNDERMFSINLKVYQKGIGALISTSIKVIFSVK